jgi:hypothetical protein
MSPIGYIMTFMISGYSVPQTAFFDDQKSCESRKQEMMLLKTDEGTPRFNNFECRRAK